MTITDDDNLVAENSISLTVAKRVAVDWHSGSKNPKLNLTGNEHISVAILGTENFDVAEIKPTTVRADDEKDLLLDGGGIEAIANQFSLEDINSDGFADLVLFFGTSDLRAAMATNSSPFPNDSQLYLFGTSSQLDSGYFFGMQQDN